MFRRILVPLDGSPLSEHALPLALGIARKTGAELHVALVHVPDAYNGYEFEGDLETDTKAHESQYLDALRRRLSAALDGPICVRHLEGIVPETLTEEVAECEIDLVVMNAHGWGYISRAILGSVSDYLMRHLTVPMLLLHSHPAATDLNHSVSLHRVLVCLDGSPLAETILSPAAELGELWQLEYRLLRVVAAPPRHVWEGASGRASARCDTLLEKTKASAAAYLASVARRIGNGSSKTQTSVAVNRNVATAVLQETSTFSCDLIAISTHGRGGASRLLMGSVADTVSRCTNQAMLVYCPAQ